MFAAADRINRAAEAGSSTATLIGVYTLSGFCSALAGVIFTFYHSGTRNSDTDWYHSLVMLIESTLMR